MPSRPVTERVNTAALLLLMALAPTVARAQRGASVLVQGLADIEGWATDSASPLLTRNGGHPAALARLRLWSAVEPWRGFLLFAQGQLETGTARDDAERTEIYLERIGVRLAPRRAFIVEAGKMP